MKSIGCRLYKAYFYYTEGKLIVFGSLLLLTLRQICNVRSRQPERYDAR